VRAQPTLPELPSYLESYAKRLFRLHEREWVGLGREQLEAAVKESLQWLMLGQDELEGILAVVASQVRDQALPVRMLANDDVDELLR
jgi:hypothetical protein